MLCDDLGGWDQGAGKGTLEGPPPPSAAVLGGGGAERLRSGDAALPPSSPCLRAFPRTPIPDSLLRSLAFSRGRGRSRSRSWRRAKPERLGAATVMSRAWRTRRHRSQVGPRANRAGPGPKKTNRWLINT